MRDDVKQHHAAWLESKGGTRHWNPDSPHTAVELGRIPQWHQRRDVLARGSTLPSRALRSRAVHPSAAWTMPSGVSVRTGSTPGPAGVGVREAEVKVSPRLRRDVTARGSAAAIRLPVIYKLSLVNYARRRCLVGPAVTGPAACGASSRYQGTGT